MHDEPGSAARQTSARSLYLGQVVALLTQHGKERVVAPVFDEALGCHVERVAGYDTDLLGTFTRDIARVGSQLEAARAKARVGMEISGRALGLASEGSFGLDPFSGVFPWNVELLIFIDDGRGIEVAGMAQGRARSAQLLATTWSDVDAFARAVGFPEHYLVVRPNDANDTRIRKGIATWPELEAVFAWALSQSPSGSAYLEVDLRADANPTRLINIRRAAVDLARRLGSLCPVCSMPGFWVVESVPGLPCRACGAPTWEIRAEVYGCLVCGHQEMRELGAQAYAFPGHCHDCNP